MPASPPFHLTPQLLFAVHRSTRDCSRASVSDSSCEASVLEIVATARSGLQAVGSEPRAKRKALRAKRQRNSSGQQSAIINRQSAIKSRHATKMPYMCDMWGRSEFTAKRYAQSAKCFWQQAAGGWQE
jgi:hypothetical protein